MKITFEMNQEDFENLTDILRDYVTKYKLESQFDENLSMSEKHWRKEHGEYVEKHILNKIIKSIQK